MKKTMIVLALLGLVSVGTMAFVEKGMTSRRRVTGS